MAAVASAPPAGSPAASPEPLVLLAAVRRSVAALRQGAASSEAGGWPQQTRESAITDIDALLQELTLYRGRLLLAHQEDGRWGSARDRDFTDWRARETGSGRGAALADLQVAEGLRTMPPLADAVENGELNLEHAKTLTRLQRQASGEVQRALADGGLAQLVDRAARDGLTAPELGKQARQWAAQIDATAAQADFNAVRRRRSLTLHQHSGGVRGEIFLDAVAGAELRTALDAISGRPAKDDVRTPAQRMVDALSTMAERTLQVGSDLNGAQVRPHLSLLVGEETWAGILARRQAIEASQQVSDADDADGSSDDADNGSGDADGGDGGDGAVIAHGGSASLPPLPDVPPGLLEDGAVVPLVELERIMCDCEVTRMVMNAEGVPLDVGRTERTFTKELRRAVTTRDRHCQWPGCHIRASWCEVHHITWFSRGGVTSLAEGISLCSFHHHRVHELDVQITALPDGFSFRRGDGFELGTTRRSEAPEVRLPTGSVATRTDSAGLAATQPSSAMQAAASDGLFAADPPAPPPMGVAPPPQKAAPPPGRAAPPPGRAAPPPGREAPRRAAGPPPRRQTAARRDTAQPSPRELAPQRKWPTSTQDAPAGGPTKFPSTYATAPPTLWDSDPPF
ncbi:DUF222 domain-containing protein [Georgenia sp. MJ173]|uniref:HNH endonuclease signature motif containing protein n=1 Tax=Georgenia sunbinii TaxID=3117728 RepID=UPI002F262CFA